MARCPECGAVAAHDARYCARCGAVLAGKRETELLLGPLLAPQYAGAGGDVALPAEQAGISTTQVVIAAGLILLVLLYFVFIVGRPPTAGMPGGAVPVIGGVGESVKMGDTIWGVAFTDHPTTFSGRAPRSGQYIVVGVVTGNRGGKALALSTAAAGLQDGDSGKRYPVVISAWGTPDDFSAGHFSSAYKLPPQATIAGLLVFDVPKTIAHPRLLIRDLANGQDFTGAIDLERGGKSGLREAEKGWYEPPRK